MQAASKRVRSIYSVIASPNRLEILRILNTKGPLTYSELKSLAGFKSKKESGKFAYHLRKLVKQSLISLNRSERKYVVTNLGRLVLNLTRQIEERSIIESGKLYVRTSRRTMEEFSADKILQSLVREAGMPVELAQKITSEAEAKIYKFQTAYLTAPLIREVVNSVLIEHGYEEYRHRLTRLGMPVYDVSELLSKAQGDWDSVDSVLKRTGQTVFSEYLLLTQLPRDVADAYLGGDIHISHAGAWGLMPDTIFFDLGSLKEYGLPIGERVINLPHLESPSTLEEAVMMLAVSSLLLRREACHEVCLERMVDFLSPFADEDLSRSMLRFFFLASTPSPISYPRLSISLATGGREGSREAKVKEALLKAYLEYLRKTPLPTISLLVDGRWDGIASLVAEALLKGGSIALSSQASNIAFSGLKKSIKGEALSLEPLGVLHTLSVNLPRLAHEAGGDDTYFRAKLALLLRTSFDALKKRRELLGNVIGKGLLPLLGEDSAKVSGRMPLVVNLTGLNGATSLILGGRGYDEERMGTMERILETANKMAQQCDGDGASIAVMKDDASSRFASIDAERYGKGIAPIPSDYEQVPSLASDTIEEMPLQQYLRMQRLLPGGFSLTIEISSEIEEEELRRLVAWASSKPLLIRFTAKLFICRRCGKKSLKPVARCDACHSTSILEATLPEP